jgi:hypothetical protein
MKEEYLNNKSITYIKNKYHVCGNRLSKAFKEDGIEIVNRQNVTKFDNHIFDKIDSEEKAYWLGFIYADGYVSSGDNTFELSLGLKDTNHLYKFAKFMKYENNVKIDSYRCRFYVCNKHFHQNFSKLGIFPRKSLVLKFPSKKIIPKKLLNHFIRGYFDGDGNVGVYKIKHGKKAGNLYYAVGVLGTEDMLTNIRNIIGLSKKLYEKKDCNTAVKILRFGKKKGLTMLDYMYKNASIYLDRKYEKYKEFAVLARNN